MTKQDKNKMNQISKSSRILIVFLLFGFLFFSANQQTQVFALDNETIHNQSIYDEIPQENNNQDEKDGIEDDWMFGHPKILPIAL